jgi:tRNA modification GTPase
MRNLLGRVLAPRHAALTQFLDSQAKPIDSGIAIYFPGPHSYTGEDVLELQGHGGGGVLKAVLRRCVEIGGRLAEPGEFTRRAYLNGKIDLAQAESVADLIDASSEAAARAAVRSLNGALSSAVNELRRALLELRMRVEAEIDFPEEAIDQLNQQKFKDELAQVAVRARQLLSRVVQGQRLREGLRVAIIGSPNVGKSTLLNQLAGESLAIVTEVPGTTRDVISVDLTIEGVPVTLLDTAGIRDTENEVEKIGVSRALENAASADLILHIRDLANPDQEEHAVQRRLPSTVKTIAVFNKVDLVDESTCETEMGVLISAKTGRGLAELCRLMLEKAGWEAPDDASFIARERHMLALSRAIEHIENASTHIGPPELIAEELRLANVELGSITGQLTADELLGEIFSRFCIGK